MERRGCHTAPFFMSGIAKFGTTADTFKDAITKPEDNPDHRHMPDIATISSAKTALPYGRHSVDQDDIDRVVAVLRSDRLTAGPIVGEFETALADRVGAEHAIVCANGTAALHLATLALEIGPGDAVVVPTLTFLATANAARMAGADIVFADVDPQTGLMRPDDLKAAIASAKGKTLKAVFPVHLNGQSCAMADIAEIARKHDLKIVEDGSHALGGWMDCGKDGGKDGLTTVGACRYSDLTTFSFHPVKAIACGEGGAVTAADPALAERIARLRNHGMIHEPERHTETDLAQSADGAANPWYYEMPEPGLNYRLSDLHCALGLSQLGKLGGFIARRRALVAQYDAQLTTLAHTIRPIGRVPGGRPAWHLYPVLIDFTAAKLDRARLMARLAERGIGTQVHYLPVHLQPYYRARNGDTDLPGAWAYYQSCLSLPLFPAMSDADVTRVVEGLADCLGIAPGIAG